MKVSGLTYVYGRRPCTFIERPFAFNLTGYGMYKAVHLRSPRCGTPLNRSIWGRGRQRPAELGPWIFLKKLIRTVNDTNRVSNTSGCNVRLCEVVVIFNANKYSILITFRPWTSWCCWIWFQYNQCLSKCVAKNNNLYGS